MSYACRVVVEDGLLPASEEPRRSENTGRLSTPMSTIATADRTPGRRCTPPAQPCPAPPLLGVPASVSRRSRRLSVRIPRKPSIAGSRVIAASTVATTVVAEAIAMPFRKLMPPGTGDDQRRRDHHGRVGAAAGGAPAVHPG